MPTPFEKTYANLNPLQKKAVDTIDGPVMVVAGPGTGKTQVLTIRIANILRKTDTSPSSILALTFTESGAHTMRERLIQFIGTDAYKVRIETFHAFCDDVIRNYPEYFPIPLNSQPLSDIEKFQLFEHLLQTLPLTSLRTINSPFHYIKPLMKTISDLKREGLSVEEYQKLVAEELEVFESEKAALKKTALTKRQKEVEKMAEVGLVFQRYQELLTERRRYDYDDMICLVVSAFQESADLLAEYQERFLYTLVDEYQDTNAAQNKVVDLLASYWGEAANLCVVGDPHQSIYRFQGASLENTLGFLNRYPTAEVITLSYGYRSPQQIYDAASAVIQNNPRLDQIVKPQAISAETLATLSEDLSKPLRSQHHHQQKLPIQVAGLPSEQHQQLFILERVKALLAQGVEPDQIAVLYRNNVDGTELYEVFQKNGISVAVQQKQNVLESAVIQQLIDLLQVLVDLRNGAESGELARLLFAPWWQLDRLVVMKVLRAAGKTNMSVYQRVQAGYVELIKLSETADITPLDFETLNDFFERLMKWAASEPQQVFCVWLETVIQESGFLKWIEAQPNRLILLEEVNGLLRFIRQLGANEEQLTLERFLEVVATMQQHQLAVPVDLTLLEDVGVAFSTVHKAKGQEWEYVFLISCVDGKWGNAKGGRSLPMPAGVLQFDTKNSDSATEDDRRLFYVALTRAKKEIVFSYPKTTQSGQNTKQTLESLFIHEIPVELRAVIDSEFTETDLTEFLVQAVQPTPLLDWAERERQWLRQITAEMPISVTAINTYLRSPAEFLARYILKVPQRPDARLGYGTAIHAALEKIYRGWQAEQIVPSEAEVLAHFTSVLEKQQLPREEFQLRRERGYLVLRQYLERPIHESQPFFLEKFFGYGQSTTMLGDIRLTGRIDRADWVDQALKTIKVFDYKTGGAKTINEINGKVGTTDYSERELALPEAIRGPLKRQLLFYKLLLELDNSFPGEVVAGVFEFVEPDRDGKYTTRQLDLLQEDVDALKALIIEVTTEIRDLQFLTSKSSK